MISMNGVSIIIQMRYLQWGQIQCGVNFQSFPPGLSVSYIPLLPAASRARGGERQFSPSIHCTAGLVSALRVPPRRGGWRSEWALWPPGLQDRLESTEPALARWMGEEGESERTQPGPLVSSKRVSPSLAFHLNDFSRTGLFTPVQEHAPPWSYIQHTEKK